MTLGTKPATAYLIDPYVVNPTNGVVVGEWMRRVTISAQGTKDAPIPKDYLSVPSLPPVTGFDGIQLGHQHMLYVDDEGILPHKRGDHFFALNGYPQPLAGRGIVVGPEIEDDSGWGFSDVTLDFDQLIRTILIGAGRFEAYTRASGDMKTVLDTKMPVDAHWWLNRMGQGSIARFLDGDSAPVQ